MSSDLNSAYLLHQKPYRETSAIADFLTLGHGKVSVVCKGIRGASRSARLNRSILQPFSLLSIQWFGRGELKTLSSIECITPAPRLAKHQLYAAMYLNELLVRLLQAGEEHVGFFANYQVTLRSLVEVNSEESRENTEVILREFEFSLLAALGFSIDFERDAVSGAMLEVDQHYSYDAAQGFLPVTSGLTAEASDNCFSGEVLLEVSKGKLGNIANRQAAKKIARLALAPHLGNKPLASRELYRRSRQD